MMAETSNCAFCRIETAEPERVIAADQLTISLLARWRLVPWHALVIPRRHIELPIDRTDAEVLAMEHALDQLHERLMLMTGVAGIDRWIKSRPQVAEGGRHKMNHLHAHILPSQPGTRLYDQAIDWGGNLVEASEAELTNMAALLREESPR